MIRIQALERLIKSHQEEPADVVRILIGHYKLGRLGISTVMVCRFCEKSDESSAYVLRQYPALLQSKLSYMGEYLILNGRKELKKVLVGYRLK